MNTNKMSMTIQQQQYQKIEKELKQQEAVVAKTYKKLRNIRMHSSLHVSDHALVRFLERVHGIDINSVRQSIITPQLVNLYKVLGNGEFPLGDDNVRAIVENGVVVTILT